MISSELSSTCLRRQVLFCRFILCCVDFLCFLAPQVDFVTSPTTGQLHKRILNGCEVWLENFVTGVAGYCSASRGLPNFEFTLNNHYRFFFLHTLPSMIVFKLGYELFYQFHTERSTFSIKKCLAPIYDHLTSCTRSSYTPWYKTEISSQGDSCGKPCRSCTGYHSHSTLIFCQTK